MLSHPLRRTLAVCASVLLVPGLVTATSSASHADDAQAGTITGTLTNARHAPAGGVTVEAYVADGDGTAAGPRTTTDVEGRYTIRALAGGTKLRFSKSTGYVTEWYADAPDFAGATSLTVPVDETMPGVDATLDDVPLTPKTAPKITGRGLYGNTVKAVAGVANPKTYAVTHAYRWMRVNVKTRKRTSIANALRSTYKVATKDLGSKIVLRDTITAVDRSANVTPLVVFSANTGIVRRSSSMSLKASKSGGRIKITVKVKVKGVAHPKGKVSLGAQRYNGSKRLGGAKHKTVSIKNGKATWTFKASPGGWAYGGRYGWSSTVEPTSSDKYAFFPR